MARIPKLEKIKKILHFDWDPIGVSDDPDAAGEYDSYALQVFSLLNHEEGETAISQYLDSVEIEYMGFEGPSGRSSEVAEKILKSHCEFQKKAR